MLLLIVQRHCRPPLMIEIDKTRHTAPGSSSSTGTRHLPPSTNSIALRKSARAVHGESLHRVVDVHLGQQIGCEHVPSRLRHFLCEGTGMRVEHTGIPCKAMQMSESDNHATDSWPARAPPNQPTLERPKMNEAPYTRPPMAPMTSAEPGVTLPQGAVIDTRPEGRKYSSSS